MTTRVGSGRRGGSQRAAPGKARHGALSNIGRLVERYPCKPVPPFAESDPYGSACRSQAGAEEILHKLGALDEICARRA